MTGEPMTGDDAMPIRKPVPTVAELEVAAEIPRQGLVRRFFSTQRHLMGVLFGGLAAWVRERPRGQRRGLVFLFAWLLSLLTRIFLNRKLRALPFPVQLRRRLEMLGPTYIKLGQILSLRRDILPDSITSELKNLLDRLPVVPFPRILERIEADLGKPVTEIFEAIDVTPIGSASIAQTHRARLRTGESVIVKVVKPGIPETLRRDAVLLWILGRILQVLVRRLQPKYVIDEFVDYTLREVDLELEADNAEIFAANFHDMPDVVFPAVFRQASSKHVMTMEFLAGIKPTDAEARLLTPEARDRVVELGATAIIRMIYRDGFFHADLHPGNLLVLPGPKVGFIDLGMVGRFETELRRTLLYYYYALVTGDPEGAARYLTLVARPGPGADPDGFRREVSEIFRRWQRTASFDKFSLGQLIMESVTKGAAFRMYFPVEMVLMVKAIVTFEGVGEILKPGLDVAAASRPPINHILIQQFSPLRLAQDSLRKAPELVEVLARTPTLIAEGMRFLERQTRRTPENPFAGIRGTIFGGFCLLAGAIIASSGGSWVLAGGLFFVGIFLAMRRGA